MEGEAPEKSSPFTGQTFWLKYNGITYQLPTILVFITIRKIQSQPSANQANADSEQARAVRRLRASAWFCLKVL